MNGARTRAAGLRAFTLAGAGLGALLLGACAVDGGIESTSSAIVFDAPPPPSLKTVRVPEPSNLAAFVVDKAAAIRLGKALFWDMQLGSDGKVACASCHFHAGADSRWKNQVSPGLLRVRADGSPDPDRVAAGGMNRVLSPDDFPLRKLADPENRHSEVLSDSNDVVSSQGVSYARFEAVAPGCDAEQVVPLPDPDGFRVAGTNVRRVEPRNTPSVINAVFNHRNFWDGRAQPIFNGVNAWGERDPHAKLFRAEDRNGPPVAVAVRIDNASLASQAVAPPLSTFEMSADGRTFVEIGDKMVDAHGGAGGKLLPRRLGRKALPLRPLGRQLVHPDDGVLGADSRGALPGLRTATYDAMVRAAFHPSWWQSSHFIRIEADGSRTVCRNCGKDPEAYSQMEYNFSLFFGLAVQLYEATLVSDDTPYDRWVEGDAGAMTDAQVRGLALFLERNRHRCINCHGGPELTNASVAMVTANRLRRREGNIIDMGFNNIGVRPTGEDLGLGGVDGTPAGAPLSEAVPAFFGAFVDPNLRPPLGRADVLGVDGAFKAPGLRNVELTAPYFHNGGFSTLRQVIEFYSRGGDFQPTTRDGRSLAGVHTLRLSAQERDDLVAFLLALTDERVRFRRAPFDHPQLFVTHGHVGDQHSVTDDGTGQAVDLMDEIPAVGRGGAAKALPGFLETAPSPAAAPARDASAPPSTSRGASSPPGAPDTRPSDVDGRPGRAQSDAGAPASL